MTASLSKKYKHAVVTGASSGIGREFALKLVDECERVSICGRNEAELEITKQEMRQKNKTAVIETFLCDLTSEFSRDDLLKKLENTSVDTLVLNAGGGAFGLFLDSDVKTQFGVVELNVLANVHMARVLLPELLKTAKAENRRSRFLLVSSHAGFMHIPHFSVYGACKAFLNSFGMTLVQELHDEPVDILVVCPGATKTKFSQRAGLPLKMVSTPRPPKDVVELSFQALGRTHFLKIGLIDHILYLAGRLLPTFAFDRAIFLMQRRLLSEKRGEPGGR